MRKISNKEKRFQRAKIEILPFNLTVASRPGENLAAIIQKAGINLSLYCQKKGLCGKCLVEILDGFIPAPEELEIFLIKSQKARKNHRLSCLYQIQGNLRIRIPDSSLIQETLILKTGISLPVSLDPAIKKFHLQFKPPEISNPHSLFDALKSVFKDKQMSAGLESLKGFSEILEKSSQDLTAAVYCDREIIGIEPGNTIAKSFGLAIDLGTTTVVADLVDLDQGKVRSTKTALNEQTKYGADVVTRLAFAFTGSENLDALRKASLKTLNALIESLLAQNAVDAENVYEVVIAGNTVMNHLLLGLPVRSLARAPFSPVFSSFPPLSAYDVGLKAGKKAKLYLAPNIKSFVGGDISAGLIASDLASRKGRYLYLDLGTNGEIVLKKGDELIATSTAAGPAFEGMNISSGMLAVPGAIYRVTDGKGLNIYTLGQKPAAGICGTGLVDLIAVLLKKGMITTRGKILRQDNMIPVSGAISLTQKDVREIQLAVAAVKTGIRLMLEKQGLAKDGLDGIYIAGAFGNYLNIRNGMAIGLLPRVDESRTVFIGNASLAGARALLLSLPLRKRTESLAKKIRFLSLASEPSFQECFIDSLEFKAY